MENITIGIIIVAIFVLSYLLIYDSLSMLIKDFAHIQVQIIPIWEGWDMRVKQFNTNNILS